ncbi:primary replicative DNA helicase [Clostridium disporicum]|uniref:Primary replicative DNA helicase n=2 Tax=Clostridium disporicum TaxID=84024 RepID=A0A174GX70_9CLOT|nr:primary replicative DNA helicase [Clostridium disporicum]
MTNRIGRITGKFKDLALEEDICVVLVAQANRGVDKKSGEILLDRLSTSDIQDSVRIEQDSDQVIGLYRDLKLDDKAYRDFMLKKGKIDYYSMDADKNPNCINAIIMKNRHGEIGTSALKWEGKCSMVSNF